MSDWRFWLGYFKGRQVEGEVERRHTHDYIVYLLHVRRMQDEVIQAQQVEIDALHERLRHETG